MDAIEPVPPEGDKVTIRERLAAHASNTSCAACHRNIDPLGFAFDQHDAIGKWRTRERVEGGIGEDPLVDASGVMPDGPEFQDANHFKQLLLEDRGKFLRAFIEHLSVVNRCARDPAARSQSRTEKHSVSDSARLYTATEKSTGRPNMISSLTCRPV